MWTPHSDPPLRLPILMEATCDLFRQNYKLRMHARGLSALALLGNIIMASSLLWL